MEGKMRTSSGTAALVALILTAGSILVSAPVGPQVRTAGAGAPSAAATPIAVGSLCAMPTGDPGSTWQAHAADLPAIRQLYDPYPAFSDVAVDPDNGRAMITDINRKSLLVYDRGAGGNSDAITPPEQHLLGPDTMIGFAVGVDFDPQRKEIFVVNNDIEDTMAVFSYGASGNARPKRALVVPHQSWGVSLARQRDELAISVQQVNAVFVYRREASGVEKPVRAIQGPNTRLADPHGVYADEQHGELIVANHGNWRNEFVEDRPRRINAVAYRDVPPGGKYLPPSINVYPIAADGDTRPLRSIQGPQTKLNYPMAVEADLERNEILVANNGDNSILVFSRSSNGDVAPVRVIRGERTGLDMPLGIAVDAKNNELWVTNSNNHTAVVFPRDASGNVAPKRIIRNAPADAAFVGFTNPMALGYDTKRDEVLVPN